MFCFNCIIFLHGCIFLCVLYLKLDNATMYHIYETTTIVQNCVNPNKLCMYVSTFYIIRESFHTIMAEKFTARIVSVLTPTFKPLDCVDASIITMIYRGFRIFAGNFSRVYRISSASF